jgi:putative PEP-CTERM system integral membrane protein
MKVWLHKLFSTIFWLWNLTFLALVYLGILPLVGIPLVFATAEGIIPLEFTLTVTAIIAIPTVCTWVGRRWKKQPLQLIRLFYGVEAPLFILALVRLFMLREMTAASNLMIGTALVCITASTLYLFQGYAKGDRRLAWLQLGTHSLMVLMGAYLGVILLFYALPLTVFWVVSFFKLEWVLILTYILQDNNLFYIILSIPYFVFIWGFSATLFLAMPSALTTIYLYSGYQVIRQFANQYGQKRAFFGIGVVLTTWMILFLSFQQQPQIQAFNRLENPASTDRERQELLTHSDSIRQGLVNAYLNSYRYLSTHPDNNHIQEIYRTTLGMDETAARVVQNWYNALMSPFLYQGSREDSTKAETLYAQIFDMPIQKGEAKPILKALQSTFNQEEAQAGLLNINEQRVLLTQQDITVTERGEWADVELYEVYENQTFQVEEVFYYFSLPESAVLTGVWLNETADRSDRYVFQISPRGAAQQVYNNQVRRNIDPALLEQVGPRQYRLRVFPVPRRFSSYFNGQIEQPKQHLWLTYKVLQTPQGWAMPQLAEKRNVFWNDKTQRRYNGETVNPLGEVWIPEFLPATHPYSPTAHQVTLPGDYQISAQPLTDTDGVLPQGKRVAILLDCSYSMRSHAKEVTETVNWLKANGFADNQFTNNDGDIYLTASPGASPIRLDDMRLLNPDQITYYGSLNYQEMLQQFQELQGDTPYDAIVLISDRGSYELAQDNPPVLSLSSPLWMVHLGGLPRAYDDITLQAIQGTGGGISTDLEEALQRMAITTQFGQTAVSVVDGYRWFVETPAKASTSTLQQALATATVPDKAGLEPLAARQLILALSKQIDPANLADLDTIHAIAKHYEIVSPYSSAIVLVNSEQKRQLQEAESRSDRFDREIEGGTEQLQQPEDMMSTSVPEPHQWLGIIGAIGLLIFAKRKWGKKAVA